MITLLRFRCLERCLADAGYADDNPWSERLAAPSTPDQFALSAIYVIVNSGMKFGVAGEIYRRCVRALEGGRSIRRVFGHPGKRIAIESIWHDKERLFADYLISKDKVAFCESLPWIGPVTKYHLAKDFGVDVAKPDVHLVRLARRDRTTVATLCRRLSRQTGYRIATVDTVLWRACATGILDSAVYEAEGWRAAFRAKPKIEH